MLHVRLEPPTDIATCCRGQVLEGRSHALLQETGVNLVDIIREEGFYVRERRMSAPTKSPQGGQVRVGAAHRAAHGAGDGQGRAAVRAADSGSKALTS